MCSWENITYNCGHKKFLPMAYSCKIYTRWEYGICQYDKRNHCVVNVESRYDCPDCLAFADSYINYD